MGHQIEFLDFDYKTDKADITKKCDNIAKRKSDCGSGLYNNIQFKTATTFNSYNEAYEWINEHSNGWYDQIAVPYYEHSTPATSKKLTSLTTKKQNEEEKLKHYTEAHSVRNFKAELVSCSCCGSKIKKSYLKAERCPVCSNDMRSKTTLDTINKYKTNILTITDSIKEEEKAINAKRTKSAKMKWLVKIEYHV